MSLHYTPHALLASNTSTAVYAHHALTLAHMDGRMKTHSWTCAQLAFAPPRPHTHSHTHTNAIPH